jgi:hypothetical protein
MGQKGLRKILSTQIKDIIDFLKYLHTPFRFISVMFAESSDLALKGSIVIHYID